MEQASIESKTNSANMILVDIQKEQAEGVANTLIKNSNPVIDNIPIVTMRVHTIKGNVITSYSIHYTKLYDRVVYEDIFTIFL